MAIAQRFHGILGGLTDWFRLVHCCFQSTALKCSRLSLAIHYPYVLAFEPTFVEIRHCETGLLTQVIQGNNLRLLFADTPPSTTNTAHPAYHQNHPYGQLGYNPYGPPPSGHPSRMSMTSVAYPGPYGPQHPHIPYQNPYQRPQHNYGRDEILMVSDDRVLTLNLVADQQSETYVGDGASMRSVAR